MIANNEGELLAMMSVGLGSALHDVGDDMVKEIKSDIQSEVGGGAVYQANVTMKNPLDFNYLSSKDIKNIVSMDIDGILTEDDVKRYREKPTIYKPGKESKQNLEYFTI